MNINLEFYLELTGSDPKVQPIRKLLIRNAGDCVENAVLRITSTSGALLPFETELAFLETDIVVEIPQAEQVQYDLQYLASLSHRLTTEMVLSVYREDQPIYSRAYQFSVDTFREEIEQ